MALRRPEFRTPAQFMALPEPELRASCAFPQLVISAVTLASISRLTFNLAFQYAESAKCAIPGPLISGSFNYDRSSILVTHQRRMALRLNCGLQRAEVGQAAGLEGLELLLGHLDVLPFGAR